MPTPRAENWTLLAPRLLLATLTWLVWSGVTQAVEYGNEVTVWIEQGQAVATSLLSGRREIPLKAPSYAGQARTGSELSFSPSLRPIRNG